MTDRLAAIKANQAGLYRSWRSSPDSGGWAARKAGGEPPDHVGRIQDAPAGDVTPGGRGIKG
jgi:hypothetical protein